MRPCPQSAHVGWASAHLPLSHYQGASILFGLLNLDKPAGITSRELVNRVQWLTGRIKLGHAGTLDPLATGVLVVCLGPATRLAEYVQRQPKRYRGTFLLGRSSDTEDVDGVVEELPDPPQPDRSEIAAVLPRFVGRIEQLPPAYSALKVHGRRAHRLARAGQQVPLAARPVQIYSIELIEYDYPRLTLDVCCGAGTYIRSLGRDIARAVGTEAVMAALTRTAIGDFRVEEALAADDLSLEAIQQQLLPPARALAGLPQVQLTVDEQTRLLNGLPITNRWPELESLPVEAAPAGGSAPAAQAAEAGAPSEIAALDAAGQLCSILTFDQGQLRPIRNFPPESPPALGPRE